MCCSCVSIASSSVRVVSVPMGTREVEKVVCVCMCMGGGKRVCAEEEGEKSEKVCVSE